MPEHKSPAEVCRERGWKAGDKVNTSVGVREIAFIGSKYVIVEEAGVGWPIRYITEDITAWSKAEPPPVVSVGLIYDGRHAICVAGWVIASIATHPARNSIFPEKHVAEVIDAMLEAGKAKVEELLGKSEIEADAGKAKAARYTYRIIDPGDPCRVILEDRGKMLATIELPTVKNIIRRWTPEEYTAISRFIRSGLAALNADAEPVAEGPYTLEVSRNNSWCNDYTIEREGGSGFNVDTQAGPIPDTTKAETDCLLREALEGVVSKLNARAKNNPGTVTGA